MMSLLNLLIPFIFLANTASAADQFTVYRPDPAGMFGEIIFMRPTGQLTKKAQVAGISQACADGVSFLGGSPRRIQIRTRAIGPGIPDLEALAFYRWFTPEPYGLPNREHMCKCNAQYVRSEPYPYFHVTANCSINSSADWGRDMRAPFK